jgi:hypothetical protein
MGAALLAATWACVVAPSDMPHRGPDMSSKDMRLMTASGEGAGLAEYSCSMNEDRIILFLNKLLFCAEIKALSEENVSEFLCIKNKLLSYYLLLDIFFFTSMPSTCPYWSPYQTSSSV